MPRTRRSPLQGSAEPPFPVWKPSPVSSGWGPSSKKTLMRLVRSWSGYCFSPHTGESSDVHLWGSHHLYALHHTGWQGLNTWGKRWKNQPHGSGHVNQSEWEKCLLPFAGASVMPADCCFSLLKGTRSSPDWSITLTLATPFPHQHSPEALTTLAKQKLRYSSTIQSLPLKWIPA